MEGDDCIRITTDFAHVVPQAFTALCFVTFMRGADWWHCSGNDELESGMNKTREGNREGNKIIGARGGTRTPTS